MDREYNVRLSINVLFVIIIMCILFLILLVLYVYFRPVKSVQIVKNKESNEFIFIPQENLSENDINDAFTRVKNHETNKLLPPLETIVYKAKLYDSPENLPGIAFCFSGGGISSMVHTIGYMRGFIESNCLNNVSFISCTAGSSWGIVPSALKSSMFPQSNRSLSELYGKYIPPEEYIVDTFKNALERPQISYIATNPGNLSRLMRISIENLENYSHIPKDMAMVDAFAQTILRPLDMYCNYSIVQRSKSSLDETLNQNPNIKDSIENSFIKRDDFPEFSVLSTGISKYGKVRTTFPIEYTADKVGFLCDTMPSTIGGQVSNYAWNSDTCKINGNRIISSQTVKYNLTSINQMVGISSFMFNPSFIKDSESNLFPTQKCTVNSENNSILVGDGGIYDNSSISSALARKIPHIFLFITDGGLNLVKDEYPQSLLHIFGMNKGGLVDSSRCAYLDSHYFMSTIKGIEDSQYNKYAMNHQKQWNTPVYTDEYICNNVIVSGVSSYKVKITWVLSMRTYQYQNKLPRNVYNLIETLPNYPNFVKDNNKTAFYNLTPQQANSILSLNSWIAKEILTPLILNKF